MRSHMLRSVVGTIIRRSALRWDIPNKVTRIEVIQQAISRLRCRKYLEIGVRDGECFCSLTVAEKIGVDPVAPQPDVLAEMRKPGVQYFSLTSDDFFQQAATQVLADGVDVVFIDGLHTYEQAYRDCSNALKYLTPGGLILLHDCLPRSEVEAQPARNNEDAMRILSTVPNGVWVGDVWKAIVRLRSQHSDVQTCVLHSDHGIGLVHRAQNRSRLQLSLPQVEAMTYADLVQDPRGLLGLGKARGLMAILEELDRQRRENHSVR